MYVNYVPPFAVEYSNNCAWKIVYFYVRLKDRYGDDSLRQILRIGLDPRTSDYKGRYGIRFVGSLHGFTWDIPLFKVRWKASSNPLRNFVYRVYSKLLHKLDGRY